LTETKRSTKRKVVFATGNRHKLHEVESILKDYPIIIEHRNIKGPEIQSDDLNEIAKTSVAWTLKKCGCPSFVEDAGLFVTVLRGFPGTFSSYAYNTIGNKGLLKLLDGVKNRRAVFKSTIAYCSSRQKPICFTGEIRGNISLKIRGVNGFGFDPIFEPDDVRDKTFGELEDEEKNRYSHRALAVRLFAEWLLTYGVK
jgi:XTP/dITP diphosphohydrolase